MGRSRGGLTTKIHALVDGDGRPIPLKLTAGQAHDGRSAAHIFETGKTGNILLADRAYDSDDLRQGLKARGAWGCTRPCQTGSILRCSVPSFTNSETKLRGCFNKLKHFRAVATRYDTRDDNFLVSVQLASIRIRLRSYESVT